MGNSESLELKEGKHILEVDEKILRDFQHCINVVDRTMTGLARSLDAMRVSCKLPFNNGDVIDVKTHEQSQGRHDNKNAFDPQVVADLHQILYDCVTDHEYFHMESLSKLFSIVLSISKDYIVFSRAEPFSFSVDRFLNKHKVGGNANGKQYYDLRIGALQKQIEDLNDTLKIAKEEVENLNEIEEIYQKEKQTLKSIIEKLEKNAAKMTSENDKAVDKNLELLTKISEKEDLVISLQTTLKSLENELSAERKIKSKIEETLTGENEGYRRTINELDNKIKGLKEENKDLRAKQVETESKIGILEMEIEMLKKTKIMHVQDFQPDKFSATTAKTGLFERIKNRMALQGIELNVIQIERKSLVDPNVPLILNCTRSTATFKKDNTIAIQLKDLPKVTKKMAVVIYHYKDEKDLPREVELIDYEAGKDLWGVFNIGFFKNNCTTNEDSINGIVDFLRKESEVRYKASGDKASGETAP